MHREQSRGAMDTAWFTRLGRTICAIDFLTFVQILDDLLQMCSEYTHTAQKVDALPAVKERCYLEMRQSLQSLSHALGDFRRLVVITLVLGNYVTTQDQKRWVQVFVGHTFHRVLPTACKLVPTMFIDGTLFGYDVNLEYPEIPTGQVFVVPSYQCGFRWPGSRGTSLVS